MSTLLMLKNGDRQEVLILSVEQRNRGLWGRDLSDTLVLYVTLRVHAWCVYRPGRQWVGEGKRKATMKTDCVCYYFKTVMYTYRS